MKTAAGTPEIPLYKADISQRSLSRNDKSVFNPKNIAANARQPRLYRVFRHRGAITTTTVQVSPFFTLRAQKFCRSYGVEIDEAASFVCTYVWKRTCMESSDNDVQSYDPCRSLRATHAFHRILIVSKFIARFEV